MAIPPNAKAIVQPLDPTDVLDFEIELTRGAPTDDPPPLLLTGESVAAFTLSLTAEAAAAGLVIKASGGYPPPVLNGLVVTYWLGVDAGMQASTLFNGEGRTLALELTITTNTAPPRIKQRTITVVVANQ